MTLIEELKARLGEPRSQKREMYHFGMSSGAVSQLFRLPASSGISETEVVNLYVGDELWEVIKYEAGSRAEALFTFNTPSFAYPLIKNDTFTLRCSASPALAAGNFIFNIIDRVSSTSIFNGGPISYTVASSVTLEDVVTGLAAQMTSVVLAGYTVSHTAGTLEITVQRSVEGAIGAFTHTLVDNVGLGETFIQAASSFVAGNSSYCDVLFTADNTPITSTGGAQRVYFELGASFASAVLAQVTLLDNWTMYADAEVANSLVVRSTQYADAYSAMDCLVQNIANVYSSKEYTVVSPTIDGTFQLQLSKDGSVVVTSEEVSVVAGDAPSLILALLADDPNIAAYTGLSFAVIGDTFVLTSTTYGPATFEASLLLTTTDVSITDGTTVIGSESIGAGVSSSTFTAGTDSLTLSNYGAEDKVAQLNYSNGVLIFGNGTNGLIPAQYTPFYLDFTELKSSFSDLQLHTCLLSAYRDLVLKVPYEASVDLATEEFTFSDEDSERSLLMAMAIYNITKESVSLGDYYYFKQQHRVIDTTKTGVTHITYLKEILLKDLNRALRAYRNRKHRAVAIELGEL